MQLIQKQQMKNYQERPRRVPGGINPDPIRSKMLGNLPVDKWKELRQILCKSFTTNMMKVFEPKINHLTDELMKQFAAETLNNEGIDVYPFVQNFTFELISNTGFGVHTNFNRDSDLRAAVEEEFSKSPSTSLVTRLCLCFPGSSILQHFRAFQYWLKSRFCKPNSAKLKDLCSAAIQRRKLGIDDGNDILNVMLKSDKIKDDEEKVLANSILFYEAAFETLSAGLTFTMYLLAKNQSAQLMVRNEIRTNLQENMMDALSISNVSQLENLDAVIKESLRMYPPQTTFISR